MQCTGCPAVSGTRRAASDDSLADAALALEHQVNGGSDCAAVRHVCSVSVRIAFSHDDFLSVKSDFFLLGRHRCVSFGYPAWASIKRSLPAPAGHLALRVLPELRPESRGSHLATAMVGSVRCEGERIVRPNRQNRASLPPRVGGYG